MKSITKLSGITAAAILLLCPTITSAQSLSTTIVTCPTSSKISEREKLLRERVAEIYSDLYRPYLEKHYCTKAYFDIYQKVTALDANKDEVGFFDWNHWSSAQDGPDKPHFKIKYLEMISSDEAIVNIKEDEMDTGAVLKFKWERDNWYVDDFIWPDTNTTETYQMILYLKKQ